jgi:hypothetical protein
MMHTLVPVGIAVAPSPVVSMCSGVCPVELVIRPVLCNQVAPVRPILAVIPVMIVTTVSIVIPNVVVFVAPVVLISGLGHAPPLTQEEQQPGRVNYSIDVDES